MADLSLRPRPGSILLVFNTSRLAYWSQEPHAAHGLERSGHFRGVVSGFHTAWPRAANERAASTFF
jgi:hypothetical protein